MSALSLKTRDHRSQIANSRSGRCSACFPNAPDAPSAAAIQVGAGDRFRGAEIRLLRKRLYNIKATFNFPQRRLRTQKIQVSLTGPAGSEAPSSTGGGLNKGKFEFRGLSPGTYVLHAHSMALDVTDPVTGVKATEFLTGKLEVTVADDEMSEAILPLAPGIAIQGKVRIEGALPGSPLPQGFFLPAVGLEASLHFCVARLARADFPESAAEMLTL